MVTCLQASYFCCSFTYDMSLFQDLAYGLGLIELLFIVFKTRNKVTFGSRTWYLSLFSLIFFKNSWNLDNLYIQAIASYLEHCKFLPKLNNELPDERNSTYKSRFSSLQNLVLIMVQNYYIFTYFLLLDSHFEVSFLFLFLQKFWWYGKVCSSFFCPWNNSLSRTPFWYQRKHRGSDTTRTELSNPFYPRKRY